MSDLKDLDVRFDAIMFERLTERKAVLAECLAEAYKAFANVRQAELVDIRDDDPEGYITGLKDVLRTLKKALLLEQKLRYSSQREACIESINESAALSGVDEVERLVMGVRDVLFTDEDYLS